MIRKNLLLVLGFIFCFGAANAQQQSWCGSTEYYQLMTQKYPAVLKKNLELEQFIDNYTKSYYFNNYKIYNPDSLGDTMYIPVVVHVLHNYGSSNVADATIHTMINNMNIVYQAQNTDLSQVIPPFVPYIGKANFKFVLATRDPMGNPTRGIIRHRTYLLSGDHQAKINQWAPNRYLNIWVNQAIGISGVAAYSTFPAMAAAYPYSDGIITGYQYMNSSKTMEHEVGHYFNLCHSWGCSTQVGTQCGDDEVDDTPPMFGQQGGCSLYDTVCIFKDITVAAYSLTSGLSNTKGDTSTGKGIAFKTRSAITIKSVLIYPDLGVPIGSPFTIVVKKGATTVASYSDTVKVNNGIDSQIAYVNFNLPTWDTTQGFRMEFSVNPGMRVDTNKSFFANGILGTINITDVTTTDTFYNFFYRWVVRYGYFKTAPTNINEIIDYPDTVNQQNIMNYSGCPIMFTKGQVERMRAVLKSNIGNRNNLIDSANLALTGVFLPRPVLAPVADFSVNRSFVCAGTSVTLANRSWNADNITASWEAPGGTPASGTGNSFSFVGNPGWATANLSATAGGMTGTYNNSDRIYFADANAPSAHSFVMEFEPSSMDNWPIFNHFNNLFKWAPSTEVGFYDNTSMFFNGYDKRLFPDNATGMPNGDLDEFYSPVYDIKNNFSGDAFLTFVYAGASRSTKAAEMMDSLVIEYTINCGLNWARLGSISGPQVATAGTVSGEFKPSSINQWGLKSIALPAQVKNADKVFFRFRYHSNALQLDDYKQSMLPVSNNFYIDRIHVRPWSLDIADLILSEQDIAVAPNPTNGKSTVYLNLGAVSQQVQLSVMDVTGKLVYRTSEFLSGNKAHMEIPESAVTVKGVYLINVTLANGAKHTTKLVVN